MVKLCPMRKRVEYHYVSVYNSQAISLSYADESFLPCYGEECMMFRTEVVDLRGPTADIPAHCALARRP